MTMEEAAKKERLNVWLVQLLLGDEYEVVAITSSLVNATDAMHAHYQRTTGHEAHHMEGECAKRHGHDCYFVELSQFKNVMSGNGCTDVEIFGEKHYAIVECEVDDPYYFQTKKEA